MQMAEAFFGTGRLAVLSPAPERGWVERSTRGRRGGAWVSGSKAGWLGAGGPLA